MIRFLAPLALLFYCLSATAQYYPEKVIGSEHPLNRPGSAAFDASGNLYIINENNYQVLVFTAEGVFIKSIALAIQDQPLLATSIAFDANGLMYLTTFNASTHFYFQSISVFDQDGNFIRTIGETGQEQGQFLYPYGISFDADGNMWVADAGNNRVQKLAPNGDFLLEVAVEYPTELDIPDDGNVYVVGGNGIIKKFDTSGQLLAEVTTPSVSYLSDIVVSPTGDVFITAFVEGIFKWNTTDDTFDQVPAVNNDYRILGGGLAFNSSGKLIITDLENRVFSFDPETWQAPEIFLSNMSDGNFNMPSQLAKDQNENIYVVDQHNHRVQVFNSNGDFIRKFGSYGSGAGNLMFPQDIVIDTNGDCYVLSNLGVSVFDDHGVFLRNWAMGGAFDGIALYEDMVYIISGGTDGGLSKYNKYGVFQGLIVSEGDQVGQISGAKDIAVDEVGNIYIAEGFNDRVQIFDKDGNSLRVFGSSGKHDGEFSFPTAIARDEQGRIYVSDYWGKRVQIFDELGNFVEKIGADFEEKPRYYNYPDEMIPDGITIASDGKLFVADVNNHSLRIFTSGLPTPIINFSDIVANYVDHHVTFEATSNVDEPITYTIKEGNAVSFVGDNKVLIEGTGEVFIEATQAETETHRKGTAIAKITINKSELIFKADDTFKYYGDINPVLTYQISGFRAEEDSTVINWMPTIVTEATEFSSVGVYPITFLDGYDDHYTFAFESGDLAILKATLHVAARDTAREYGEENPPIPFFYYGLKNNETIDVVDELTVESDATLIWPVGAYFVHMTKGQDDNYEIIFHEGAMLEITKAPLTVKINDITRSYDDPNHEITVSYSGFKNGENESVIDVSPTIEITNVTLPVGEYAIDAVYPGSDNNYELILEEGKLIITKATQVITFNELESPVLNTLPPFALNATSDSDLPVTYEITEGPASYESELLTLSGGLGTVVITASQPGNENYHAAASVTRSFEVIQDPILGVEDGAGKFRLYPNPTLDGNLFVSGLSDEITEAVLIDSKGLAVRAKSQPSNGDVLIDTGVSPSGLYVLCLKTISGQKYFRKVIVQK